MYFDLHIKYELVYLELQIKIQLNNYKHFALNKLQWQLIFNAILFDEK